MRKKKWFLVLVCVIIISLTTSVWAIRAFRAEGKPDASGLRYELWHDAGGWHLRWTGFNKVHHFSGRVWSPDGNVFITNRYKLEREDSVWKKGKRIHFSATSSIGIDGFDFRWKGRKLLVELKIDGRYRPMKIFIGSEGYHPKGFPLVIVRGAR